jgi:phosphoglycolate phosphatase-like HAD superfamily hydrolase
MYLFLFDIDGTLVSMKKGVTGQLITRIMRELYGKELPPGLYPRFAGRTDLFIIEKIAEMVGADIKKVRRDLPRIFEKASEVYEPYMTPEYVDIMPGVAELIPALANLDNVLLGLITGNHEKNAYLKLSAHGLDKYFKLGAFGNDSKNRGDLPLIGINRANKYMRKQVFGRYNTLIIGDTRRDIECAHENDLPVAAVSTGLFGFNELSSFKPDILFNDFSYPQSVIHRFFEFFRKSERQTKIY